MTAIKVPPLGESIVEATVSRWLKKEGDAVAAGETVVELETDKITVEVPAQKAGVLARRSKNEGDVVHVDDELGTVEEGAAAGAAAAPAPAQQQQQQQQAGEQRPAAAAAATAAPAAAVSGAQTAQTAQSAQGDGGVRASP